MKDYRHLYLVGAVDCDYDQYDSFVIAADSVADARRIAIDEGTVIFRDAPVKFLGMTTEPEGIILGSFNAG